MTTHEEGREYDIIFAGGGTAACVAAGRLAQADPNLSILIVEQGKNNKDDPLVTNPAMYLAHLAPNSQTALFYQTNAEEALNGRESIVPAGGLLGGGSSINFMMYTRAQGCDFDSWKTEGWDFESLLPYLRKLETYHVEGGDKTLHGYGGPINISHGTYGPKGPQDDFLDASESLGYKEIKDLQDFKSCGGFSRWARYIGPDGKRQDTAHRYIHPLMEGGKHPNLHLLLESKVSRVIFEGNKAVGVEYYPNPAFQEQIALTATPSKTVRAKKMVIVSAGTMATPSILERSGVGSSDLLQQLDIEVVSNVPGVGEEYQDHHLLLYPYKTTLSAEDTIDGLLSGRLDFSKALASKNPILGWNAIDVCSKLRPSDAEVEKMGPDFQKVWERDFKQQTDRPIMLMGVVCSFLGDHKTLNEAADGFSQYCTMGCYTAYPYSRGNIHIKSKDPQKPASFNTGFLSHPADLPKQVWAYKKQREIYRRTNAYNGELAMGHPTFPDGSKAACVDGPVVKGGFKSQKERADLKPIEYSEADDKAIEDWIRSNLSTTWHSLGTCKMAPKETGGVVDKTLSVYGTQGLKCCDLSIVPENVGANTNNTALVVGEKAAALIGEELGINIDIGGGHLNGVNGESH